MASLSRLNFLLYELTSIGSWIWFFHESIASLLLPWEAIKFVTPYFGLPFFDTLNSDYCQGLVRADGAIHSGILSRQVSIWPQHLIFLFKSLFEPLLLMLSKSDDSRNSESHSSGSSLEDVPGGWSDQQRSTDSYHWWAFFFFFFFCTMKRYLAIIMVLLMLIGVTDNVYTDRSPPKIVSEDPAHSGDNHVWIN